jgi:cytochrome b involved in lipid metabolism
MLDVAGQDATEAFEDVGHSDEARETLAQLYCGDLKRQVRSTIWHTNIRGQVALCRPRDEESKRSEPRISRSPGVDNGSLTR